jgi:hypothetical protein
MHFTLRFNSIQIYTSHLESLKNAHSIPQFTLGTSTLKHRHFSPRESLSFTTARAAQAGFVSNRS